MRWAMVLCKKKTKESWARQPEYPWKRWHVDLYKHKTTYLLLDIVLCWKMNSGNMSRNDRADVFPVGIAISKWQDRDLYWRERWLYICSTKILADTCIDYRQMVKIRKGGRVVDNIKRIIFGTPCPYDIETTNVENFNGISMERNGRLVRKTKCFSKLKWRDRCSLLVLQFHWNFINRFRRGSTTGLLEGIVEKPWTWDDFLMHSKAV